MIISTTKLIRSSVLDKDKHFTYTLRTRKIMIYPSIRKKDCTRKYIRSR